MNRKRMLAGLGRFTTFRAAAAAALFGAGACAGATNDVPVKATAPAALAFNAGADLRVRQEITRNVPGLPGGSGAVLPRAARKTQNRIRYRPRVWTQLDAGPFTLYGRLVDEMREYPVKNGVKRKNRSYTFPDEVVLDNLYLEGRGLFDGFLDFRFGRQDLFLDGRSAVGLDRIMLDGTPADGSRSSFADMLRVTLHPSDTSSLDVFALYDNSRNDIRWGNHLSRGRALTALHPSDSPDMDEWGGGIVWNDVLFDGGLPYQLYVVHKHAEAYTAPSGARIPDKQVTTVGAHVMPAVNENLSFDLDVAQQFGTRSNGAQAGGAMAYAALDVHRAASASGIHPYARLSAYYLSGDRHSTGEKNGDTAWDPMWSRAPQDSELVQNGTLYALGYWSNMLYTKLTLGTKFGAHHGLCAYSGPMWAAAQDHLGHADGSGDSMFKGVLSVIRYDFPILLAPKNARGTERFEIFGHLLAEMFNPGDYYDTSRPSYFLRWEINIRF